MSEGATPPRGTGTATGAPEKLDKTIGAALADWPMEEREPVAWDPAASRSRTSSLSDEDLFAAPLPQTAEDGRVTARRGRERDRDQFRDLVKLASSPEMTPPPSSAKTSSDVHRAKERDAMFDDDSGVLDLKSIGADTSSPGTKRARIAPAPVPATSPNEAVAVTAVAPHASTPRQAPAVMNGQSRKPVLGYILGGAVALAAIAAGAVFLMKGPTADDRSPLATTNGPPQSRSTSTVAVAGQPTQPVAHGQPAPDAVDPAALPLAQDGTQAPRAPLSAKPVAPLAPLALATASVPLAAPGATETAPADTVAPIASQDPPAPSTSSSATLEEALRQAAGATSSGPNAESTSGQPDPGNLPMKPSQGVVQAGMNAVLPSARACLNPDDAVSNATVVFSSSGGVLRVSVGGGAAGKPAEACIRAALMRARVPPFAQPTFNWSVLIRPT